MGVENVNLLIDAFDTFKKASTTLESYYKGIEKRVEGLNIELDEKNNYLTSIFEGLPVGIMVIGRTDLIETVNGMTLSILEKEDELLVGKTIVEALSLSDNISGFSEMDFRRELEITLKGKNGKKKTITINSTILKNLHGLETGCLVVLKDISEVTRLKQSVQRDKRLTAMGQMAASIAHQIRNPLGSIELFASLLNEDLSQDQERGGYAKEILTAVKSLNTALSNMLLFANSSKPYKTDTSISALVEETVAICDFLYQDNPVQIKVDNKDTDQSIFVDKELLKQALLNLIMNGVSAVKEKRNGVVSIRSVNDNGSVHITVTDNGVGISDEEMDKIFDPFFTTKPKGTGLGLTVVNNIVIAHEGLLDVESTIGKGTVFEINIPMGDSNV